MPKRVVNEADLNRGLLAALNTKPNYSEAFTAEVRSLADVIGDVLSAPVEHDDDMNYSSAQKIVVWLDRPGQPVPPKDRRARYRLFDYVSSRAHYFAFVTLRLSDSTAGWREMGLEKPGHYWVLVAEDDLPGKIRTLQKRIASVMESRQYTPLEGPVLSHEVEGHITELDGKPATVFEVLFSEVY